MNQKHLYLLVTAAIFTTASCKTQQIKKSNKSVEREATSNNPDIAKNYSTNAYIDEYKDIAIQEMNENGIPASITLAQGILESNFGNSDLARYANNHFGIKCTSTWKGKGYFKDDDQKNDCFRVYKDAHESYKDHSDFLKRKRYAGLFQLDKNDYVGWAKGLKQAGYATNPNYANLLISTIEKYNLTQFDQPDTEKNKIARQDKIFGDINAEMAKEDAKYAPVNKAPKGIVTTSEAKEETTSAESPKMTKTTPTSTENIPVAGANDDDVVLKTAPVAAAASNNADGTYTVQPGDGLYKIAKLNHLSVDELKSMNTLADDQIKVGQILKVKKGGDIPVAETPVAEVPVAETPVYSKPKKETTISSGQTYTVQKGEGLYKIAKSFNLSVDELKALNGLTSDEVQLGQVLKISGNTETPKAKEKSVSTSQSATYTVQKGDSLYRIAKMHNIDVATLKQLNNLSDDAIKLGQVLKVKK